MSLERLPDSELISRFAEGQDGCFAELVARYQESVFCSALYLCGSEAEAENISEEVFTLLSIELRKLSENNNQKSLEELIRELTYELALDRLVSGVNKHLGQVNQCHDSFLAENVPAANTAPYCEDKETPCETEISRAAIKLSNASTMLKQVLATVNKV